LINAVKLTSIKKLEELSVLRLDYE